MKDATTAAEPGGLRPDRWLPLPAALIAAGMAVILFATAGNYGPFGDEFYYLDCARHLAPGYVDHPPLVALVALLAGKLLGWSYLSLRVVAALAAGVSVLLAARLAARLGGGSFARTFTALAMAAAPGFWAIFSFYSMNALDVVIISIGVLIFLDILNGGSDRLWIALGCVMGVGLLNKLTMLPFGFAALVALLVTGHRSKLATPWPWIGGAIAGLLFSPNLIWQMQHGWPTLEFIRVTQQFSINPLSAIGYLLQLVISINPVLAPLWIFGLICLFRGRPQPAFRALGILALVFLGIYTASRSKVYYVFPIMPVLLAAGAVGLERFATTAGRKWVRWACTALASLTGLALLPIGAPVLPAERFIPYGEATGLVQQLKIHQADRVDLPVHFALRFGWREMVQNVARAYESLPDEDRTGCLIIADNYSKTGALNYYRREFGLPEAVSGHNNYRYWLPQEAPLTAVIGVGLEEQHLGRYLRDVELFTVYSHPYAPLWETDQEIFIAREPLMPWAKIREELHWY